MSLEIKMERRKPETLQDLCFQAVMQNFDRVTSRPYSEAGMRVLQMNSQLLLEKHKELDVIHRSITLFCVNRYLKELLLAEFHVDDVLHAVHKLTTVGCALIALDVSNLSLDIDILGEIVRMLPETVQRINFECTVCTDSILKNIAQQCPKLKELDLLYCRKVTNAGVQALCLKDKQGNVCPNLVLEKLNLCATKVNKEGILFALQNFPNLSEINSQYLDSVLCDMYKTFLRESSCVSMLNLKSVRLHASSLKACFVLCPFVTVLHFTIHNQENFDVLVQFRLLEEIDCFVSGFFDFFTFFEAVGKTLKHLVLYVSEEKSPVSIEFIIKFCPRLEYLHLCCSFTEVKAKPVLDAQYTLKHLRVLQLVGWTNSFLEESLKLLLSRSPNLKKFEFKNKTNLMSVSFQSSIVQNISMSTLETLELIDADMLINVRKLWQSMPEFECHVTCNVEIE